MTGLNFFCQPYGKNLGIPVHTREFAKALMKKTDITLIPIFPSQERINGFKIGKYLKDRDNLMFWYPDSFSQIPETGTKRIGYYIFEYTIIPKQYIEEINKLDAICTASKWGVEILKKNGVTIPCYVVPGGSNPTDIKRKSSSIFTFVHVGKAEERKGTETLIRAFNEAFKNDNKFRLKLSIGNPHIQSFNSESYLKKLSYELPYGIDNINTYGFMENISDLYSYAHCTVFPTRAEGIGLPIVECMAAGIPTIVSNSTGITEYANKDNAILLTDLKEEEVYDPHFFQEKGRFGTWQVPSMEELKEKMLWVYSNYEKAEKIGEYAKEYMKTNYSWDMAASKLLDIL